MMFSMRAMVNIDPHLLAEAKIEATRTSDTALESFPLPTDGGSGVRPGIDLEGKDQLADLRGDNLPRHVAP